MYQDRGLNELEIRKGARGIMKYKKKPVIVEAFQLNERGLVEEDWFWDAVSENKIKTYNFGKHSAPALCVIETLEGNMTDKTSDYISRGRQVKIYQCKTKIFEQTYKKVD